ncbi:hypothetical protein KEM55_007507 [Ascosphaera atra]|nr:hypothetical protein KEM55_007507 [Ascosphaera atra]
MRSSGAPKPAAGDPARRQMSSGSPAGGGDAAAGQRRSNTPKAWSQNLNPITQKPISSAASSRRATPSPKPANQLQQQPAMATADSTNPDLHANDRMIFFLTASIVSRSLYASAFSPID